LPLGRVGIASSTKGGSNMATWLLILLIVLALIVLFGGFGVYSR
jgi:hypothetical protein